MQRPGAGGLPSLPLLVAVQTLVAAASLVVEIVAGRMLAPYVGMSLYTWTSVIAVVLAGFSAGHWLGGRLAAAPPGRALRATGWALLAAAASTAGALLLLRLSAGPVLALLPNPVAAIVALTGLVFFLPSFFAGVPAPVLAQIAVLSRPDRSGPALGAMFAAGALGAIAGTLLAGFVFISWLGTAWTLAAITGVYLALAAMCFAAAGSAGAVRPILASLAVLGLGGAGLSRPPVCDVESDYFCIRVVDVSADPASPVRLMVLNHLAHGISARDAPQVMFTDHAAMLDRLALARMGDDAFSAFFIGGGTYSIPRAWAQRPDPPAVTVAEIDPAVTQVATVSFWFDPATARIVHGDARLALARDPARYDVIVGDAFTDIAVPPHLVTREFLELVAARLTPDGIYLMNVIDHADRLHALAAILRTLRAVFPVVEVWTERQPEPAGQRKVFILLAGTTPTAEAALTTRAPGPYSFGRLSRDWQERTLAATPPVVLTDNFAPIDRLMRFGD